MRGGHAFVDESKVKDYLLVSAAIGPGDLAPARQAIRELLLPGQPRLHMKNESEPRRRKILATVADIEPEVRIYRAPRDGSTEIIRRGLCLRRLVADMHRDQQANLCLELDETLERRDNQLLIEAARGIDDGQWLSYRHERARHEPLLAIPDALAWAWPKGGDWRRRCGLVSSRSSARRRQDESAKPERHDHSGRVSGSLSEAQRNGPL